MPELGSIGISDEHVELHASVRRWVQGHVRSSDTKALLDLDPSHDQLPVFWDDLVAQGWLGLHLAEAHGGEGFGLVELAVVLEELGAACAPGPFLPTAVAAALVESFGADELCDELLMGVARGEVRIGLGLPGRSLGLAGRSGGPSTVTGSVRPVLSGGVATHLLVPCGENRWCVLDAAGDGVTVTVLPSVDATRPLAEVAADGAVVPAHRVLAAPAFDRVALDLLASMVAAESVGGMDWCVATAAAYANERVQFGRPIGQFQAVKHRCADMLLALELARGTAWDVARAATSDAPTDEVELAACVAGAVVPDAFLSVAKDCVQVLGGIGYTWEHDAHLYLKRALALHQLVGGPATWQGRVAAAALAGTRRSLTVDLPPEADDIRSEVRAFVADVQSRPKAEWTATMAEAGYLVPNWPKPWGRDASAVEQLVIDAEFAAARIRRPHLQVGAWVLPTLIGHGTAEQQERWIPPTLRGEIAWCQLFSEPGAGSDLASLTTRAERDEARGGWVITGQKVWTTMAHIAQWGLLLARTDPDAPKHDGITAFVVDMAAPGIEIRPLRELTGAEMFNEVFFTEAFVPDDCVVGPVNGGWDAARTTLANERVSMGSGSSFGPGLETVVDSWARRRGSDHDATELGALVARAEGLAVLGLRTTLRALSGAEPGPEASVRKLLATEHEQQVQELGLSLLGPDGAVNDGESLLWVGGFLGNRALSIAGGTSDVQRNIVAERILGLPKDP